MLGPSQRQRRPDYCCWHGLGYLPDPVGRRLLLHFLRRCGQCLGQQRLLVLLDLQYRRCRYFCALVTFDASRASRSRLSFEMRGEGRPQLPQPPLGGSGYIIVGLTRWRHPKPPNRGYRTRARGPRDLSPPTRQKTVRRRLLATVIDGLWSPS